MIAIVSPAVRERAAFAALCETRGWPCVESESLRAFGQTVRQTPPRVLLVRHKLGDGYSDDAIALLARAGLLPATKIVVLMAAGTPPAAEARQVALGADCVQRDPVRTDVLIEYLAKYQASPREPGRQARRARPRAIPFAGARLLPLERTLEHRDQSVTLTPREAQLIELLAQSKGAVVSYDTLYSELLHRRFRGDTSNMRVLLGKLTASAGAIGIALRRWIEVIPKTGYRYREQGASRKGAAGSRPRLLTAA